MSPLISYQITESDLNYTIRYTKETVDKAFLPLIDEIVRAFSKHIRLPYLLGISGPPGCGKSSISAIFQILLCKMGIDTYILPLDGFHLSNEELQKRETVFKNRPISLYEIKGAKETYDVEKLIILMEKLREGANFYWPVYSRNTHDPVDRGIYVKKSNAIYIIEGNYLFLNCEPWNILLPFFNKKIFISSKKRLLKKRVIWRKRFGGFSKKEARSHYRDCDSLNIDEVLKKSKDYDYMLIQNGKYRYKLKSS